MLNMKEKWLVAAKKADFNKWAADFGISPVTARILRNRGLTDEEQVRAFLGGTMADCHSPHLLRDMDRAVGAILEAVHRGEHIRVIGDYDVDGICSSYILTRGLRALGAEVDTAIPHRIHDGYGLSDHLIELAAQDGVQLIVTCDNGIAAAPQIELAARMGIDVVVTDHHEVPYETDERGNRRELLPPALAVVDPKRGDDTYPFLGICGAVVAYKLMQALLEQTGQDADLLEELLELAAFATVCDVMELLDENRIIVREGLKRMRNSRNLGLRALIEVTGIEPERLSAYHLGFVLGPCLNATGRLDTAQRALELLESTAKPQAMMAARELKNLNDERKSMTQQGIELAEREIARGGMERDRVLVVFVPGVHESLAGIIAGRIRERYNRPTILLTRGEEGVKGSGRSIETYSMYEALTEVKELFTRYGGHKMAAGLSMTEENVDELRRRLNENCRLTEDDFIPRVHIDVPMPLDYADEALAEQLSVLEPFGVGNPKPLFAQKDLTFCAGRVMGKNGNAARYRVRTPEGGKYQLVYFGDLAAFGDFLDEKYGAGSAQALYEGHGDFSVSVVYQLGLNTYRGETSVQFVMQHFV